MTVSTLRPTSTDANSGCTITGGATVHAVLADNSDASYITSIGSGDQIEVVAGPNPSSAGALLKSIAVRARHARTSAGSMNIEFDMHLVRSGASTVHMTTKPTITWTTITTNVVLAYMAPAGQLLSALSQLQLDVEKGSSTAYRLYELYADVTYVVVPVADVTDPAGTITDTNLPTVGWGATLDSDGGPQTHYEVKIFTDAQYGAGGFNPSTSSAFDQSGIVEGTAGEWTPSSIPLPNDTYRAYVRVAQLVNGYRHWSAWDFSQFTIAIVSDPPDPPDFSVTPEDNDGRVRIDIDTGAGTGATTDYFEIQRSSDGGATWQQLRNDNTERLGFIEDNSPAVLYDFEGGNGETIHYRARSYHDYSGMPATSDWLTDSAAWFAPGVWWLKCPEVPSLNAVVVVNSQDGHDRPAKQGVWQPLGSSTAVVVSDVRGSPRGAIKFQVDTEPEKAQIDALLDQTTLLLQGAPGEFWTDRYVAFGDQSRKRWIDRPWIGQVIDTVTWYEVRRPTGPLDAWPA